MKRTAELRSPFPYFGGKSFVAKRVWKRFGVVRNYVEPFFGSGAVLLQRPRPFAGTETVNDLDGMVANFWRALQADPDEVVRYADWIVSECDLSARHLWLTNEGRRHVERLKAEPDYYDAKIAGWWVWGICQWIGSGWCHHPEWQQLPHLGNAGSGIHRPSQQRPHLGDAGRGIHRPSQQLPHLGDAGMGIHRPSQKLPHLGDAGMGIHRPSQQLPHLGNAGMGELYDYFHLLAERLRGVRVCCGDWSRVCGPTPTVKQGLTAVFLDPPYTQSERDSDLYAMEVEVATEVRRWCLENGNDRRLRIALCGYAGEGHEELERHQWRVMVWKPKGGYGSQAEGKGRSNATRERIWFSPHCLHEKGLFDALDSSEPRENL